MCERDHVLPNVLMAIETATDRREDVHTHKTILFKVQVESFRIAKPEVHTRM